MSSRTLSSKCKSILNEGVGGKCGTKQIRAWVGCQAQAIRIKEGSSWGDSMRKAWGSARSECRVR